MHPLGRRIADVLELQPDATAIEYDGRWSTWREVTALVEDIRALEVGQRQVGILLRNKPPHVAAFRRAARRGNRRRHQPVPR
jgi:long-chain acyl-CoA synthetase